MTQSVVTVRLNGTPYQIGCGPGEEDHVAQLGAEVETILQELVAAVGQIGEARLLAMVTLILADKASEAAAASQSGSDTAPSLDAANATASEDAAAAALESAAEKIAALATTLATKTATH